MRWRKQLGSTGNEKAFGVAIDRRGNAYIAGYTSSNLAAANAGQEDGWIARYSVNGKLLWRRQFGSAGIDFAEGIAVDQSGNAFVSGYTDGDLFSNNAGRSGTYDAWIVRYTASGQQTWSEQLGSNQFDASLDVTVDRRGNVYTAGYTNGDLVGTGSQDLSAWFARYSPA
ncbi:SBBP repeat-containing protein [Leptolyngbya sp. FACHB-671]|uniref:SBBP repeat-containing protein n=1 Tax=Leptolyngbya sp. FACHB-671 TaxID=2692812 RepID=UPI0016848C27|nr:SBBP repeat-containing protein [Leptolyngbya sp. FACHB-671]MBD2069706.1 SBBP repeat-containing protein [Leptolyngbya sp. FACHB-671]